MSHFKSDRSAVFFAVILAAGMLTVSESIDNAAAGGNDQIDKADEKTPPNGSKSSPDIMYRRYSDQFVNAVEEMKKEVENGSIDGTSTAWVNVTMKCLKCHEWVRNTTLAAAQEK